MVDECVMRHEIFRYRQCALPGETYGRYLADGPGRVGKCLRQWNHGFDGVPAPLLYASSGQVNLVTPGALASKSSTQVCAVVNGASINCLTAPVQLAAPGMFSTGGYAAAVNQDGTINSQQNPAPVGSVISIYVTGLGAMTPEPADGSITPLSEPSQDLSVAVPYYTGSPSQMAVPWGEAEVLYAGSAPLQVEGLEQINLVVPAPLGPMVLQVTASSPFSAAPIKGSAVPIWVR